MVKRKTNECEACVETEAQCQLKLFGEKKPYRLCMNCHHLLTNLSLSEEQFNNLIKKGHSVKEFLLHSDFYDEDGYALQSKEVV